MKVSFFRALIGSCSGTKIFEDLHGQRWWRTIGHLLLMNLLCAAVIVLGMYLQLRPQINGSIAEVVEQCGAVRINSNGITPTKDPERARSFIVSGPLAVTYLPVKDDKLPENFTMECKNGLIFSGKHAAFWSKVNDNKYDLVVLSGKNTKAIPVESTRDFVAKMREADGFVFSGDVTVDHKAMLKYSKFMAGFTILMLAGANLLQIAMYIAMFAAVFALMHIGKPKPLKVWQMVTLAVYAGFPPMIIGSLACILQLPFLDFNMIYVLGMTFYLMFIMNRFNRNAQMREWQNGENKPL